MAEICREHQISQVLYYCWRDKFLEAGQKALSNGGPSDEVKALRAKVEKLEKIIGRQTIAIELLKNRQFALKVVKEMRSVGLNVAGSCEVLGINRSLFYGKKGRVKVVRTRPLSQELVERIKQIKGRASFLGLSSGNSLVEAWGWLFG